jgi:hypothetical protein
MRMRMTWMYALVAMLLVYCVPVQSAEESARPGYSEVRFSAKGPVLEKVLQYFRDKGATVGKAEVLCRNKKKEWFVYYTFDLEELQGASRSVLLGLAYDIEETRKDWCDQEVRMRGGKQDTGLKKVGHVGGVRPSFTLDEYLSHMKKMVGLLLQLDPLPISVDLYCTPHADDEDYKFWVVYPEVLFGEGANTTLEVRRMAEAGYQLCEVEMPLRESI